jgi:L-rhamnose-H+ transport protein
LFGIGSVTFGLGLQLAGLSLGNSLMVGIISVTGSLVPMLILSPESIVTPAGGLLLLAMLISVIGVIYCSIAGNIRAKSLDKTGQSGEKKAPFKVALIVCIVSGVFSSMLNVSLVLGLPVAELAMAKLPGAFGTYRAYNAVWAITLSGAFVPYLIGCVFLLIRNKSLVRYEKFPSGFKHALLMGILWFSCITLYGAGASQLGKLGTTIGWLILMAVTVIVGNLWGLITGEWEHAPIEAKQKMTRGLVFMFLSVVVVGIAKYLS